MLVVTTCTKHHLMDGSRETIYNYVLQIVVLNTIFQTATRYFTTKRRHIRARLTFTATPDTTGKAMISSVAPLMEHGQMTRLAM